jgi:hypothetical protein
MTPLELKNRFDKATAWAGYLIPLCLKFLAPHGPFKRLRRLPLKLVVTVMWVQLLIIKNI